MRALPLASSIVVFGLSLTAPGQTGSANQAPTDTTIALPAQVEVARLVDLLASRCGVQISYDPQELTGTITLRSSRQLSNAELWQLGNELLASKGLTTVVRPGSSSYSVVKLGDAAGAARVDTSEFSESESIPFCPGFITRQARLSNASPTDLLEQVKLVLSPTASKVSATTSSKHLLVSDLAPRVDLALQMVAELDQAAGEAVTEEVRAVNIPAAQLASAAMALAAKTNQTGMGAATLGEVIASPTTSGVILICPSAELERWKSLLALLDQPQESSTRVYALRRFPLADVSALVERLSSTAQTGDIVSVVRDDLTNSLIVTARPKRQEEIAALIERLENTPGDGSRPVREFAIKNRPVNELVSTLNSMIAAGAIDAAVDTTNLQGPDRDQIRASSEQSQLGIEAVGARRASGATPEPAPSVSLSPLASPERRSGQAVSAARGDALSLTVDAATNTLIAVGSPRQLVQLERIIAKLDVRQPQVMVEVLLISLSHSDTLSLGIELDKIDTIGDTTLRLASLFGLGSANSQTNAFLGGTAAVFSPGEFSVLVRALQNLNQGRSVSIPRVLVNNNQAASFGSTVQQPFATSNATNSSTTITFGGSQSAGTTISVTPQISEGDHLILTYNVSLSSFVGSATSSGLPPPRQENRIDSVATIPDGYTVAVGGLDLTTNTTGTTQVPWIAEIPLLGELFKSRDNTDSRSRFYVFIRANVMRQDAMLDLRYASESDAIDAGVDTGWPQVKPQVIR